MRIYISFLLLAVLLLLAWPVKVKAAIFSSQPADIARMLDLAAVTSADTVYDLGAGDGRIVIAAAKRGAKAIGIEINPENARLAWANIEQADVKAEIRIADFFQADFSDATVVTLYIGNAMACRLKPRLQTLRAGTRIVSNGESICGWTPDRTFQGAALWVVQ
jgi:tRNA A58 N-methylase Trm61